IRTLLFLLPEFLYSIDDFRRGDFQRGFGLTRVDAVCTVNRCGYLHLQRSRPEAVRDGLFLLWFGEQILNVRLGRFAMLRRYPLSLHHSDWMVAPERAFFRIDRDNGER